MNGGGVLSGGGSISSRSKVYPAIYAEGEFVSDGSGPALGDGSCCRMVRYENISVVDAGPLVPSGFALGM